MQLKFTYHAVVRMAERQVTRDDIEAALNHANGPAYPGKPGSIWFEGATSDGRRLRVCVDANDPTIIITVDWKKGE